MSEQAKMSALPTLTVLVQHSLQPESEYCCRDDASVVVNDAAAVVLMTPDGDVDVNDEEQMIAGLTVPCYCQQ